MASMKIIRSLDSTERADFNAVVTHPLQTWEWGEFRRTTGVEVERIGVFENGKLVKGFQATFHAVPKLPYVVGYVPKSVLPDEQEIAALKELGLRKKALFIKLEPNIAVPIEQRVNHEKDQQFLLEHGFFPGRPLFTKYSFLLDISKSEEELLAEMRPKTRYNIHLAQRKGVSVAENNSQEGLEEYIKILKETTSRQKFYAHDDEYFRKMWSMLAPTEMAKLLQASYLGNTLVVWIAFIHQNKLYYPYGSSSNRNREVMASNLMMWEMIKLGKSMGCQSFDMWGSLGPNPDPKDPWYGFHTFKEGYGGKLVEFIGSYDLVVYPALYTLFRKVEDWRWKFLRLRSRITQ